MKNARTLDSILHNMGALRRLERQIVRDLATLQLAPDERHERIVILKTSAAYLRVLGEHAETYRKRLYQEATAGARAASTTVVTEENILASDKQEVAAPDEDDDARSRERAIDDAEKRYFRLFDVRPLPAEFRTRYLLLPRAGG